MADLRQLDILESYLKEHKYNYERKSRDETGANVADWGEQIVVYNARGDREWDAICCYGSYGYRQGLLEVMGSKVIRLSDGDKICGWLTAQDVINRLEGKV